MKSERNGHTSSDMFCFAYFFSDVWLLLKKLKVINLQRCAVIIFYFFKYFIWVVDHND